MELKIEGDKVVGHVLEMWRKDEKGAVVDATGGREELGYGVEFLKSNY